MIRWMKKWFGSTPQEKECLKHRDTPQRRAETTDKKQRYRDAGPAASTQGASSGTLWQLMIKW